MTSEEMERAIEFLLDHHAKVSTDIERHSEQVGKLAEAVSATQAQLESAISEMREGFNNLILANEVTRNLAEEATKLAIQTSRRLTGLEDKSS
jgi:ABC-type transporter Mla subunit MlaD